MNRREPDPGTSTADISVTHRTVTVKHRNVLKTNWGRSNETVARGGSHWGRVMKYPPLVSYLRRSASVYGLKGAERNGMAITVA